MRSPKCPLFALLAVLALAIPPGPASAAGYFEGKSYPILIDANFPADAFILEQARFWYEIYVHVAEDEGLIHDPLDPALVLRKVRMPISGGRAGSRAVESAVKGVAQELRAAIAKDGESRSPAERQLLAQLPPHWDSTAVTLCAERIRFQRGLKNKFRAGVERSYRYLPLIDSVFSEKGLPDRLKYLPHVESSFYPHAYSKVGAAGMWQFMKSAAKTFKLKAGYQVDERRDPHASTRAAAGMLSYNYARLKSWPLALVAYNHGPGGMARAVRTTGTSDLGTIIKSYYSESFGFASKNFYAEFLAASSIALQADSLYPGLAKMAPLNYQRIPLPRAISTKALGTVTGLSASELEEYNLALRPATFRSNAQIPKGYVLNLPMTLDGSALIAYLGGGTPALAALAARGPKLAHAASASSGGRNDSDAQAVGPLALAAKSGDASPADRAETPEKDPTMPSAKQVKAAKRKAKSDAARPAAAEPPREIAAISEDRKPAPSSEPTATKLPVPAPEGRGSSPLTEPGLATQARGGASAYPGEKGLGAASAAPGSAEPLSAALPALAAPPKTAAAGAGASVTSTLPPRVVDSSFALQASDLDKLAHPMDRFNPTVYGLGQDQEFSGGHLLVRVGTEETLSHYAEWAWVPEKSLRALNRIRSARDMRMGRRIKIPMPEAKVSEFLAKREEYYRAIEEDFYGNYYVSATEPVIVAKGMNLWSLIQAKEIPYWLLQKHNPGKLLGEVRPGDTLSLPVIETGIRKWGFTRYGNSKEYLAGIARALRPASGSPAAPSLP